MTQQELLDYIVEKFNITMDFKTGQLETFFQQLCEKVVTWELITSILLLLASLVSIITIAVYIIRKNKKENMFIFLKDNWYNENINKNETRKFTTYILLIFASIILILLILLPSIISETIDIIQCIVFTEKTVIEFFGKYIK